MLTPQPKADWYCPVCEAYVSAEQVNFHEEHVTCGTPVIIKEEDTQTLTPEQAQPMTKEQIQQEAKENAAKYVDGWDNMAAFTSEDEREASRHDYEIGYTTAATTYQQTINEQAEEIVELKSALEKIENILESEVVFLGMSPHQQQSIYNIAHEALKQQHNL